MNNFEFYMIDLIKDYTDRLKKDSNEDIEWMHKCVLDELLEVFSKYQVYVKNSFDI